MTILRWLPRFRRAARALDVLESREAWSRAEIEAFQLERLNDLWSHAIAHVPYYARLAREHALPPRFASLAEFTATVPELPRLAVRHDSRAFLSARARPGAWKFTSGSSGTPMAAYWSHDAHRESLQAKYRAYAAWGVDVFDRTVFLWSTGASHAPGVAGALSRARQPVVDRLRNRLRLSATTLSKPALREYLAKMRSFGPAMLYGYSRALYLLALEAEAAGYDTRSLKLVVATSEPAWPHMIERIERAFHAPVAREYGALECGIIATDAPDRTLRVREDHVLLESRPRDDGRYDLLVTVLNNPSFPLIRYAIGDVTDHPIGRTDQGFAILAGVAGRDNDLLRTRSGAYLNWVDVEFAMEERTGRFVRRFALYQRRDGSVEAQLEPNAAVDSRTGRAMLAELQAFLQDRLEGYPVTLRVVDAVEQTRAGKHRTIRSELYDADTAALPAASDASGVSGAADPTAGSQRDVAVGA